MELGPRPSLRPPHSLPLPLEVLYSVLQKGQQDESDPASALQVFFLAYNQHMSSYGVLVSLCLCLRLTSHPLGAQKRERGSVRCRSIDGHPHCREACGPPNSLRLVEVGGGSAIGAGVFVQSEGPSVQEGDLWKAQESGGWRTEC